MGKVILFDTNRDPFIDESFDEVISIEKIHTYKVKEEVIEIIESLREEYGLECTITNSQIDLILRSFYRYYEEKEIVHSFDDVMIGHFNDMAIDAIENRCSFDYDFVLSELQLYELLDSQVEVDPRDTKKIIKKIRNEINSGR